MNEKTVSVGDWLRTIDRPLAVNLYTTMLEIREFEEKIRFLFLEGNMPGTVHQYIGQEACATGVCAALHPDDVIASTHRPHGHAIARGLPMDAIAAELYGKDAGCCRGKGGSMHIGDISRGMFPAIATVGDNIPIIAGAALSFKLRGEKRVAVAFFGDGASNEGAFHEALNCAAIYNLPAVFVCENNLYGASTPVGMVMKVANVADRAAAYGMRSDIGDGMNVFEVHEKAKKAIAAARAGEGPTLLELKTYRYCGHSRRDPNNYMPKEEKEAWKTRDPLHFCETALMDAGILDRDAVEEIKHRVTEKVEAAMKFGQEAAFPDPSQLEEGLYTSMRVPE
jgi:pyruvate dehydrogenase E1 component alpha subunit